MDNRELELQVLEMARPLFIKLYGEFEIDPTQTDRPDAAIEVKRPHKRFGRSRTPFKVGIEITTVDKSGAQQYLKDEKFGAAAINEHIENTLKSGVDGDRPIKKINIDTPSTYLYEGIYKKFEKHASYAQGTAFRELILLCFSEVVSTSSDRFADGLHQWTNYHLSVNNCPFDKVVFVSRREGEPVRIYEKKRPLLLEPSPFKYENSPITVAQGPILRVGAQHNLVKPLLNPPLLTPKKNKTKKP